MTSSAAHCHVRALAAALVLVHGVLGLISAASAEPSAASVPARAAPPSQAPTPAEARAVMLFGEGKALYEQGQFEEACRRFEESQKLRPGIGTQFQLASCWARIGRAASARALFLKVADETRGLGQLEREQAARDRAEEQKSRLSYLVIQSKAAEGVEVRQNGAVISGVDLGKAFPVDPGVYEISVSVQGKKAWSTKVRALVNEPSMLLVELPAFDDERRIAAPSSVPVARAPKPSPPVPAAVEANPEPPALTKAPKAPAPSPSPALPPEKPSPLRRGAAIALTGVGVLSVMTGGAMLEQAIGNNQDAEAVCPSNHHCTSAEASLHQSLVDDARKARTWAIAGFAAGSLALLGASYLYFTDPGRSERTAKTRKVEPSAVILPSEGLYGAVLRGRF